MPLEEQKQADAEPLEFRRRRHQDARVMSDPARDRILTTLACALCSGGVWPFGVFVLHWLCPPDSGEGGFGNELMWVIDLLNSHGIVLFFTSVFALTGALWLAVKQLRHRRGHPAVLIPITIVSGLALACALTQTVDVYLMIRNSLPR